MSHTELETRVAESLHDVLDPCSCMTENPIDIVDLGLVEDVTVEGGVAHVSIMLTSPMCLYTPQIVDEIQRVVGDVDDVTDVEVDQVTDELWSPDRMAEHEREKRREQLHDRMRAEGIEPYTAESD
jgi:metal-sulfur cluster biosynthetic enzyme